MVLFFNNAVNTDLAELGNWWQDAGFTIPAVAVPTGGVNIAEIHAPAASNTGDLFASASMAILANNFAATVVVVGEVNISTGAVVITGASITAATIVFTGNGSATGGTLVGAVTLPGGTDPAQIAGVTVTGDLTFSGTYTDAFPDNAGGTVSGAYLFTGTATFNGGSNIASPTWNGASATIVFNSANNNSGTFIGNPTFAGGGSNSGAITGNATFAGTGGGNTGTITGDVTITGTGTNTGGTVTGNLSVPQRASYTIASLGTYGTLTVRASGGGGGPLGGPGIEF